MAKRPRSVNLENETWARLVSEAKRRGISVSALISLIVNDSLNPRDGLAVEAFQALSKIATMGLAPWKTEQKPSF